MAEVVTVKTLHNEVVELKKEVEYIKNHMLDPDMVMTPEENERFEQSMQDLADGKAVPLDQVKRELGL